MAPGRGHMTSYPRAGDGTGPAPTPPPNLPMRSWLEAGRAIITLIEVDGTYKLESLTSSGRVYKIDTGYPPGEYLLLENWQPLGCDSKL